MLKICCELVFTFTITLVIFIRGRQRLYIAILILISIETFYFNLTINYSSELGMMGSSVTVIIRKISEIYPKLKKEYETTTKL